MIVATWTRAKGKMTLTVEGHEGAPEGEALVCCAVSTIMQTAVCGLLAIAADHGDKLMIHEVKSETGDAICERCGHADHRGGYCRTIVTGGCTCYVHANGRWG